MGDPVAVKARGNAVRDMYSAHGPFFNIKGLKELELSAVVCFGDDKSQYPAHGFVSVFRTGDKHELTAYLAGTKVVSAFLTRLKIMVIECILGDEV
jgi:hypothetical protein